MSVIEEADPGVSEEVHSSGFESLRCSGILGDFGDADQTSKKLVHGGDEYQISLSITDDRDEDVFHALLDTLLYDREPIELENGDLYVDEITRSVTSPRELMEQAAQVNDATEIRVEFQTPAIVEDGDGVSAAYPHRGAVFENLLRKWHACVDEPEYELAVNRSDILDNVYSLPVYRDDARMVVYSSQNTHSSNESTSVHGFEGKVKYRFKKSASESIRTALIAVTLLGEYTGVGGHTARGAGTIDAEIN
jgi:CRISPR-associated endoribonuclease Cas6